ncbi:DUF3419 family protein [Blastopirellula retiformator]|uniref:S-adenosylmethionine:diacylglycerol 3-amino-3-carboxypropyl transferase n=1 Tax=Blastopirellula retiformator TaxID=2527970 RepID=A0A5C5V4B1_9BACT|nr:BtaA family protein [Blastopirellula retiformator]TWT33171.1 hypothetical protein Enr8_29960 [Blastopirellula retiformator]
MALLNWVRGRVFNLVHQNNLVYNTCWEDPRLDRVALDLEPHHNVMVITSAGCNALDYALAGANHVYAVDMNPRQNALLDLKKAAIRELEYEDFFAMFGTGRLTNFRQVYEHKLRQALPEWSQSYWNRKIRYFRPRKNRSFYFRGTSGSFARAMNIYVDRVLRLRPLVLELLDAKSIDEQKELYEQIHTRLWTKSLKFAMSRDTTWSLVGVPRAQREYLEQHYENGIVDFVQENMRAVFAELPIHDNYFWRVYVTGEYTQSCCPEYLKPENFQRLKDDVIHRVSTHTDSVEHFLRKHDGTPIHRLVLLDHMDWLTGSLYPYLVSEWQAILDTSREHGARVLWRSGGMDTQFVNEVPVVVDGQKRQVGEMLQYNDEVADQLHPKDRVHTYGAFRIADLAA